MWIRINFQQEYQYKRWVPWSEHTTCSLTEARMLFAVFSASILRPVEPSRMANRSPSSVTGLCSGAGIPPVWTHTITAIIPPGKKKKTVPSSLPSERRVLGFTCRHYQQNTNTRPHVQYGQVEEGRQCFKAVTVQIAAIWRQRHSI